MDSINYEENFQMFYRMAKILILELKDEDKVLAAQWLRKLAACKSPNDAELRNHYMTLLLITLQQQRIVGPFKQQPVAGSALEVFPQEYQPADIQQLIVEDLAQTPPPPLVQFALTGNSMMTEFAVAQEIPKFGVHFYYVCALEPIYEFQRIHQSRIPRPLLGPTRSTMRELNAGVERVLRAEKSRMKITLDKSGKKKIQIRDENFAAFSETAKKGKMSKRLQKRLGVAAAPEPEPEVLDDSWEKPSPKKPPVSDPSVAKAFKAGAASAAATGTPKRKPGAATKPKSVQNPGAPKPGIKPPTAASRKPGVKTPGRLQRRQQPAAEEPSELDLMYYTSPLRYTRDPSAPPTPPLFIPGVSTKGMVYEQEDFGVDPSEEFKYSKAKLLKSTWSPSQGSGRTQVLDIIEHHPITEDLQQIRSEERPRIRTPEVYEEIRETQRRTKLLEGADPRTRLLMQRFYSTKDAKPRALVFSQPDETTMVTAQLSARATTATTPGIVRQGVLDDSYTPILLDDTDEFLALEGDASYDIIEEQTQLYWAEQSAYRTQDIPAPTGQSSPIVAERSHRLPPASSILEEPSQLLPPSSTVYEDQAEDAEFLADAEMEFEDDSLDWGSPLAIPQRISPRRTPVRSPQDAVSKLEQARRAYRETIGVVSPQTLQTVSPKTPQKRTPPKAPSRVADDRLLDISGDVPYISPKTPTKVAAMMDLITGGTPARIALIMEQIDQQVEAHHEIIANIKQLPRTRSVDNMLMEFSKGSEALEESRDCLQELSVALSEMSTSPEMKKAADSEAVSGIRSRIEHIRQMKGIVPTTPKTPPRVEVDMEAKEDLDIEENVVHFSPLGLQLQDLSGIVESTIEGAQLLKDVAATVDEQIVQQAADQSNKSVRELMNISNRLHDLTQAWEYTAQDMDESSLGIIEDEDIEDIFGGSPTGAKLDRMVEALDQSVKEVIAEGGVSGSAAAEHLQTNLRNFQQALQEISFHESLLEGSLEPDALVEDSFEESGPLVDIVLEASALVNGVVEELERSLQAETVAVANVSASSENDELLEKSNAVVEGLAEVLDQMVAIEPEVPEVKPRVEGPKRAAIESRLKMLRLASRQPVEEDILIDVHDEEPMVIPEYEPFRLEWQDEREEILADEEMTLDDLLMEDEGAATTAFFSKPVRRPLPFTPSLIRRTFTPKREQPVPSPRRVVFRDEVKQEMMNLMARAQQQQEALLNASLTIQDNASDAAAIAASQRITQLITNAHESMADIVSQVQQTEEDTDFAWLGPIAHHPLPKKPALKPSARAPGKPHLKTPSKTALKTPSRPTAGMAPKTPARTPARPAGTAKKPSGPTTSTAIKPKRPTSASGSLAPPPGVQVPKPRAGSATPIPVKRPPHPIPLPSTGASGPSVRTTASTSSLRATLPRPTSAATASRKR
ncbi:uncharacterized protein LOC131429922 [Malaya genurostris]|uniref:uncharacterized protein LOC131429922 n=1 Tax=Malaya genurostris TaxID=325434 RepID=UPI0026F380F6|nr:uncharacterized protein LOC131429922 [Malaya genurostris]